MAEPLLSRASHADNMPEEDTNMRTGLTLVLSALMLLIACGSLISQPAELPVVEIDAPGILDSSGATYLLTKDITVPRTAFMIKGDGITLDLGGHTVTYGTEEGIDRCSGVFLRPPGAEEDFKGVPLEGFGGGNDFTLKNGRLVQGPQPLATKLTMRGGRIIEAEGPAPGRSCFAVYIRGCTGLEITGITSDVNSRDTDNLYIRNSGDVNVHDNRCISTVQEITDRHYPGTAVITVANVYGPIDIHHNVIDGGGQCGIKVAGERGQTGHLVQVHHNVIRHRNYTTNGYAIAAGAPNMRIFANVVKPAAGRGVHLTKYNQDLYNNIVDVWEAPNPEYPRTRGHGVKLEGARYARVHHNFIRSTAEKACDADPLDIAVPDYSASQIFKNTIVALRKSDEFWATSVNILGPGRKCLVHVYDNVFRTNHRHFRLDWGGGNGVTFERNRWEVLGSPEDYSFWTLGPSKAIASGGIVFRDNVLAAPANFRDVSGIRRGLNRAGLDYSIEHNVNITTRDPAGSAIAGIGVEAYEAGRLVASGLTNSEGRASVSLRDFRLTGDDEGFLEEHGPYELKLFGQGFEEKTLTVDPTETTDLPVTLKHPDRRVYVYAGEGPRIHIGDVATLEGKVAVVPEDAGTPEVAWRAVSGETKVRIEQPTSPKIDVLFSEWGQVTFEFSAKLGDEVAKSRVAVRADAQIAPVAVPKAPATAKLLTIVQLDGTESTDPRGFDPRYHRYKWTQVAGPEAILSSDELPDPIFYPTEPGEYTFELTMANPIRTSDPVPCSVRVTQ
ncbi:MAG: hypothetical protein ACE5JM_00435 [Armatimonadota bacterium]